MTGMFHNKDDDRFEVTYNQNTFGKRIKILHDKDTGVNYLYIREGYGCGLTPLFDSNGKPARN